MIPVKPRAGKDDHQIQRDKRKQKIYAYKETFCKREDVLGKVDFIYKTEVGDNAAHGQVGRLTEVIEESETGEQICQIAYSGSGELENIGENERHYAHHHDRIQQTPRDSKNAAFIFNFKISAYKLLNKKTVFFY